MSPLKHCQNLLVEIYIKITSTKLSQNVLEFRNEIQVERFKSTYLAYNLLLIYVILSVTSDKTTVWYLRSWSEPSSDLSSLLFIKGNFRLNEKFFFFLSKVDCCKKIGGKKDK